jgi:hypothetical protein
MVIIDQIHSGNMNTIVVIKSVINIVIKHCD